ncbi:MAG: M28 family metallopeptidase [Fimbriimonadales bacterium]
MRQRLLFIGGIALAVSIGAAQGDPGVIAKILDEGKSRNQVMKHLEHLSTKIGARLTGSPSLQKACEWTRDQFQSFGLTNCNLEEWGSVPVGFQRGARQIGRMVSPMQRDFEFTTSSWTAGTNGLVRGRAVMEPSDMASLNLKKRMLKGAWIIAKQRRRGEAPNPAQAEVDKALDDAGIAGRVRSSRNDLVLTGGNFRDLTFDNLPKAVNVTVRKSDYDAILAEVGNGKEVQLEFDLENTFVPGPVPLYNVVAEIRGTEKPDEVVIVSGHLDSWDGPGSQGTCDNGTGTMVALEAARILMASDARPKRTIRFILWTGEEQGLLGSRAYVEKHKAGLDKISAVFVDDGGTNYEGGLVCIAAMQPLLAQAIEPVATFFPGMPVTLRVRETMPKGGGSDHSSFNAVGVPGFFWAEDGRADYNYVHHTQHDKLEQAIPEYLVQSSTVAAVTAYNLACADTLLPRQK